MIKNLLTLCYGLIYKFKAILKKTATAFNPIICYNKLATTAFATR